MKRNIFYAAVMILLVSGCESEPGADSEKDNGIDEVLTLTRNEEQIAASQNEFALDLFKAAETAGDNIIVSPLTTTMSMSMGVDIIANPIQSSIVSKFGANSCDELHNFNKNVRLTLPAIDKSNTSVGLTFGFWYNSKFSDASNLIHLKEVLTDSYKSYYEQCDFAKKDVMSAINKWVNNETQGAVQSLITNAVIPETRFVAVSTLDFKAKWKKPFKESSTNKRAFKNSDNSTTVQDFMADYAGSYYKGENYSMTCFPFGNESYEMLFILPDKDYSVSDVLSVMRYREINNSMEHKATFKGAQIFIPKFNLKYCFNATEAIKDAGVTVIYESNGTAREGLEIYHGINVSIDENGASVLAATATENVLYGPGSETIVFDRPFVFLIRESTSGLVMAIGKVSRLSN